MSDLEITRGDDRVLDLTLSTASGAANLNSVDLWFTVKESVFDDDSDAIIQKTIGSGITVVDTAGGLAEVEIDSLDTSALRARHLSTPLTWDVQLKDSTGEVQTVASGTLTISPDVTHSS